MTKLGKFEIKEQLGQGGMGVVYRAWDSRMERWVALKTIAPEKATRADFMKRFRKEALSAGRLDHPNIVTVYEFDEQDDVCYIAMQYLEGSDLESLLASPTWEKEFTIFPKLNILIQTCQGLAYAHRNSVVHRDIKPANIMILPDGTPKLVDFGIARMGEGTSSTQSLLMGTAPYMSPEQVEGRPIDERVDIFAVGVIGYRMFTGHFPFEGPNLSSILHKILHEPPPPMDTYSSDFPTELERILLTALAKDREQRYRAIEEMGFELQGLLSSINTKLISSSLEEVRRLILLHDFPKAKDMLRRVLEQEPGNPVANSLWQQVQKLLQQEYAKRKVQGLLSEGIEAFEKSEWVRARDYFEQGLLLDTGHEMLQTYRNLTLREIEKTEAVSQHLKAAREAYQRRDLPGTRQHLSNVLDANPDNTEAQGLLLQVDAGLADIGKRRDAQQYLDRAQEALASKQFAGALSMLDKAQALDPENTQANRLRSVVLAEQAEAEQQKLRAERIASVQSAVDRGEFDVAVQQAEVGLRAFPNDPALLQLQVRAVQSLEAARRKKLLSEQFELAKTFLGRDDLSGARKVLATVREKDPHDPRVQDLAQSVDKLEERVEREKSQDTELERARLLMRENRHDEARIVLFELRNRFGSSPALQELLDFLTQDVKRIKEEREVQDILQQAAQFLESDSPEKAVQFLRKAARKNKAVAIDEELNRAIKLESEATGRRTFLERASRLVKKKQWKEARDVLEEAPDAIRRLPSYKELWQTVRSAMSAVTGRQDEIATGVIPGAVVPKPASPKPAAPEPAPVRVHKPAPEPSRQWVKPVVVGLVLLAAVVLVTLVIVKFVRPAPAVSAVRIDITPWAELENVTRVSTGEVLQIQGQTPLEISLPEGEYRLRLTHPRFDPLVIPIRVEAGKSAVIRRAFSNFHPEQVLKAYE